MIKWAWLVLALLFFGCDRPRPPYVVKNVHVDAIHPESPALFNAIWKGDAKEVRRLLDSGVSVRSVTREEDGDASTALEAAGAKGNVDVVRLLLDRGAPINEKDEWGGSAVLAAAQAGQPKALEFLLSRGANLSPTEISQAEGYAESRVKIAKKTQEKLGFQGVAYVLQKLRD